MVLDIDAGSDVAPYTPANRLALYRYDIAGQRTYIPDDFLGTDQRKLVNYGGTYNATKKNYTFIVTAYLQDLLDGKTQDFGTFIAPTGATANESTLLALPTSGGRSVIGSFTNPNNKVKLNIYYTKIQ